MKNVASWLLTIVLLLLTAAPGRAQGPPAWQTAMALNTVAAVSSSAADAQGNVYLAGSFTGTAVFGSVSLSSAGAEDIFVAKWSNSTGRFVWAQRAGGTGSEAATTVAVQGTGIYVSGYFRSAPATFGSLTVSNAGFLNTSDMFVAKLTDAGASADFSWVQRAGSLGEDQASALAVSGTSVYVAGQFTGPTVAFGATPLTSNGDRDIFITKLTDAGTSAAFAWAQRMGSSNYDYPQAISVSGSSIYVAGRVGGTVTFNNSPQTGTPFGDSNSSSNGTEAFVVKLTDGGTTSSYRWIQRIYGNSNSEVSALAVEGSTVYLGGRYYITGAVGPSIQLGSITLSSGGNNYGDIFVAKLADAGATSSFVWARQAQSQESFNSINSLKANGPRLYVAGSFALTTGAFGAAPLVSAGGRDVFVVKLTDTGLTARADWAQRAGGPDDDAARSLTLSGSSVQVVGEVRAPASFGSQVLMHPLQGESFGFIAGLTDPTITGAATAVSLPALACYPNPARTAVHVPAATAATALTLLDVRGRAVRTATGPQLPLGNVAPGLYLLRAATPGQPTRTGRLVVE